MSFTQGRIEKPIIQTDADEGQADYPFSAPIRREDVEGADVNDDDAMEVEQVCVEQKKKAMILDQGPFRSFLGFCFFFFFYMVSNAISVV